MDSNSRNKTFSPNFTRLDSVDEATRKRIESEKGATDLKGTGLTDVKAKMSRRGSIIISRKNIDETHTIDILHSARTARQLTPDASAASKSQRQRNKDATTYHPPEFEGSVVGHVAHVKRFQWTSGEGFRKIDDENYNSGKSGGSFGATTKTALEALSWPNLDKPEASHHSEAEYAAKNYGPSVKIKKVPPRDGLLVHQIEGFNDMCRNCQTGLSGSIAKPGSGHVVTYTGRDPFKSTGDWNEHKGLIKEKPGTIFRSRPESMLSGIDREDHMARASEISSLRAGSPSVNESSASPSVSRGSGESKKRPRSESIDSVGAKPKPSFKPVVASKATAQKPNFKALAEKPKRSPGRAKASSEELSPPPAKQPKRKEGESPGANWTRGPGGRLQRQ